MRHRRRVLQAESAEAVERGDGAWAWVQSLAPRLALWRADVRMRSLRRQLVGLQNAMGFADPPRLEAPSRGSRWVR